MEPITIITVCYTLTLTTTFISSYYISNYIGEALYNKMVKLRSSVDIFI